MRFTLLICASLLFPLTAQAGAWTKPKGKALLITTARASQANKYFDRQGNSRKQPSYKQYELGTYGEYGLTNRFTIGFSTAYQQASQNNLSASAQGDSQLFTRYQLYRNDTYALSVQPTLYLPSANGGNTQPAIGSRTVSGGASLLGGRNFTLFSRKHYAEAETGYRVRGAGQADQALVNFTLGLSATDSLTVMPQLFQTIKTGKSKRTGFTQSPRDDYTLTTLQLSALYDINARNSVQLGAFSNVAGENTGAGHGLLLAWWREF